MKLDLEAYRRRIELELERLGGSTAQADDAARTVVLDQSSVGRLSRMDAMQQQAMARGIQERLGVQQRKLEAALDRIAAGTFGCCCACEAEIELERLDGDPAVVFCFDCMMERNVDWSGREKR